MCKKIALLLVFMMILTTGISTFSYAAEDDTLISLNGKMISIPDGYGKVFFQDGRTMVPLRAITEAMGLEVNYKGEDKTIHIPVSYLQGEIVFQVGSKNILLPNRVASMPITMDTAPASIDGRIHIPLRYLAEILGYKVDFKKVNNKNCIDIVDFYPKVLRYIDSGKKFNFEVNGKDYIIPQIYGPAYRVPYDNNPRSILMLPAIPIAKEFGYEIKVDDKSNFSVTDIETNGKYNMKYMLTDKLKDLTYDGSTNQWKTIEVPTGKTAWYDTASSFKLGYIEQYEVYITEDKNIYISMAGLEQILSKRNYATTSDNTKLIKGELLTERFGINDENYTVLLEDPLKVKRPFLSENKEFKDSLKDIKEYRFYTPNINGLVRNDLEGFYYKEKSTFGYEISYTSFEYDSTFCGIHISLRFDKGLNDENKEVLKRVLMASTRDWEAIYNKYIEIYNFECPNGESVFDGERQKGTSEEWKKKSREYYDYTQSSHIAGNTTFKLSMLDIQIREKVNNPSK